MLQPLKNKILEAVPEIMELKFGCEVKMWEQPHREGIFNPVEKWTVWSIANLDSQKRVELVNKDGNTTCIYPYELSTGVMRFEILGRPIRLADVLLAIPNKSIVVTADGLFGTFDGIDSGTEYPQVEWDLRNDDLEKQSPETIEFLTKLLL